MLPETVRMRSIAFADQAGADAAVRSIKAKTDFEWLSANAEGRAPKEHAGLVFDGKEVTIADLPPDLAKLLTGAKAGDLKSLPRPGRPILRPLGRRRRKAEGEGLRGGARGRGEAPLRRENEEVPRRVVREAQGSRENNGISQEDGEELEPAAAKEGRWRRNERKIRGKARLMGPGFSELVVYEFTDLQAD